MYSTIKRKEAMDITIDGVVYKVDYEPEEEMKNVVIIKKDY